MTPDTTVILFREALMLVVVLVAVMVLPSLVVGLVVSIFQAATQINEQTLSFLPRLITTLIALLLAGPWMLSQILEFCHLLISNIPYMIN